MMCATAQEYDLIETVITVQTLTTPLCLSSGNQSMVTLTQWSEKVCHLGNIIDKDCTELADCVFKKSMFTGYVNKIRCNFRHLQPCLSHIVVHFARRSYGNLTLLELINVVNL